MEAGTDPTEGAARPHERWDDESISLLTAVEDAWKPTSPMAHLRSPLSQLTNTPRSSRLGQDPPCIACESPESSRDRSKNARNHVHSIPSALEDSYDAESALHMRHEGMYMRPFNEAVGGHNSIPSADKDTERDARLAAVRDHSRFSSPAMSQHTLMRGSCSPDVSFATVTRNTHRVLLSLAEEVCCRSLKAVKPCHGPELKTIFLLCHACA